MDVGKYEIYFRLLFKARFPSLFWIFLITLPNLEYCVRTCKAKFACWWIKYWSTQLKYWSIELKYWSTRTKYWIKYWIMFAVEAIPSLCNHFPTVMFVISTGNALPCPLNEFISVLQYFGSVLQYFSSVLRYFIHQHANLALQIPHNIPNLHGNVIRNIQNKLGNRALKSDLKSTVTREIIFIFPSIHVSFRFII